MPEIHWRHYAENKLASIRRKLTVPLLPKPALPEYLCSSPLQRKSTLRVTLWSLVLLGCDSQVAIRSHFPAFYLGLLLYDSINKLLPATARVMALKEQPALPFEL